jgi:hypothetical protein
LLLQPYKPKTRLFSVFWLFTINYQKPRQCFIKAT